MPNKEVKKKIAQKKYIKKVKHESIKERKVENKGRKKKSK